MTHARAGGDILEAKVAGYDWANLRQIKGMCVNHRWGQWCDDEVVHDVNNNVIRQTWFNSGILHSTRLMAVRGGWKRIRRGVTKKKHAWGLKGCQSKTGVFASDQRKSCWPGTRPLLLACSIQVPSYMCEAKYWWQKPQHMICYVQTA